MCKIALRFASGFVTACFKAGFAAPQKIFPNMISIRITDLIRVPDLRSSGREPQPDNRT